MVICDVGFDALEWIPSSVLKLFIEPPYFLHSILLQNFLKYFNNTDRKKCRLITILYISQHLLGQTHHLLNFLLDILFFFFCLLFWSRWSSYILCYFHESSLLFACSFSWLAIKCAEVVHSFRFIIRSQTKLNMKMAKLENLNAHRHIHTHLHTHYGIHEGTHFILLAIKNSVITSSPRFNGKCKMIMITTNDTKQKKNKNKRWQQHRTISIHRSGRQRSCKWIDRAKSNNRA